MFTICVTIYAKTQSSAKNGTHQKWLHEALLMIKKAHVKFQPDTISSFREKVEPADKQTNDDDEAKLYVDDIF